VTRVLPRWQEYRTFGIPSLHQQYERNRICCNNIARLRTTLAAGCRVSQPPAITSTRATGSQAIDSAYTVPSPRFGDLQQFGQGARSQGL
jgi:hypothetical protein